MTLHESSQPSPLSPESFDMPPQELPVYVVNIDRAAARMAALRAVAETHGVVLERVAGVDGTLLAKADRVDVDEDQFYTWNGRPMLPGEYGCYRSHLLAFERLVASGEPAAIVVEDDIAFDGGFLRRARALLDALPSADVIKLVNHRASGFRPFAQSRFGDRVGRCLWGPQGSAACYLITRKGAEKLLPTLKVIALPFDVALERGWASDAEIFTAEKNILPFGDMREATVIATRADYRSVKPSHWRRLPAYLFRLKESVSRFLYARRSAPKSSVGSKVGPS